MFGIDAVSGAILYNPQWIEGFSLMEFDNSTGIPYGIYADTTFSVGGADFVSINPTNFIYSTINHLNIRDLTNDTTFDDLNHRYIFAAIDSLNNKCLFCLDAVTGIILSKPLLGYNVGGIRYDNVSGNLYGLE